MRQAVDLKPTKVRADTGEERADFLRCAACVKHGPRVVDEAPYGMWQPMKRKERKMLDDVRDPTRREILVSATGPKKQGAGESAWTLAPKHGNTIDVATTDLMVLRPRHWCHARATLVDHASDRAAKRT